jgi:hypothetical protein
VFRLTLKMETMEIHHGVGAAKSRESMCHLWILTCALAPQYLLAKYVLLLSGLI